MVFLMTAILLAALAFLVKFLPERAVILLWGKRRRDTINSTGALAADRPAASRELSVTAAALLFKVALNFLLWSFFHSPSPW